MFAFLRGVLLEKHPNQAVIDVGGVGYDVQIPVSTFSALPAVNQETQLRIHTHVREDAIVLFGFSTLEEKILFERLTSVTGIGPKVGLGVLSGLAVPDLVAAIRNGQTERLVRIPGIGKKTAERIVLELRDKLDALVGLPGAAAMPVSASPFSALEQDVLSALVNLGAGRPAAETALQKARKAGTTEEFEPLFRKSLELVRGA